MSWVRHFDQFCNVASGDRHLMERPDLLFVIFLFQVSYECLSELCLISFLVLVFLCFQQLLFLRGGNLQIIKLLTSYLLGAPPRINASLDA